MISVALAALAELAARFLIAIGFLCLALGRLIAATGRGFTKAGKALAAWGLTLTTQKK